jgi:ABC-type Na+ efflux pump permease subunit
MKTILTVFRKELGDSLRDRRTLVAMVFVPLILFPVMISISSSMMISQARKAQQKVLKIGVVANGGAQGFIDMLSSRSDVELVEGLAAEDGAALVRSDSLDAFIVFDAAFDEKVAARGAGSEAAGARPAVRVRGLAPAIQVRGSVARCVDRRCDRRQRAEPRVGEGTARR